MVQTKALRKLWMSVSSEDAERMVGLLDADHNGQISLDEFRRFVYLLPESLVPQPPLKLHLSAMKLFRVPRMSWTYGNTVQVFEVGRVAYSPGMGGTMQNSEWACNDVMVLAVQVTPTNIVYALVDSSDWIEGVELRLCMTPPKQPFQRYLLPSFLAAGLATSPTLSGPHLVPPSPLLLLVSSCACKASF